MADRMGLSNWTAASFALVVAGQSSIEHDASTDQSEDDRREQQQRAPILGRMAQNTDEMAAIVNRR